MNASQLAALGLIEVGTLPANEIMVAQVSYPKPSPNPNPIPTPNPNSNPSPNPSLNPNSNPH